MTARARPGRPAVDGATGVKNTSIALTDEQRGWLKEHGGSSLVRRLLDREIRAARATRGNTAVATVSQPGKA